MCSFDESTEMDSFEEVDSSDEFVVAERFFGLHSLACGLEYSDETGWAFTDIDDGLVALRTFGMGHMNLLEQDFGSLDKLKCLQIATVHDMGRFKIDNETFKLVSTVPPEAMEILGSLIGPPGAFLYEIYEEYRTEASQEAKFIKQLVILMESFTIELEYNLESLQESLQVIKGKFQHRFVNDLIDIFQKLAMNQTAESTQGGDVVE